MIDNNSTLSDHGARGYSSYASRQPMLTEDEEFSLASRYIDGGDIEARNKLVLSHLKLANSIAVRYLFFGFSLSDLMQEANIGLIKAANAFDPSHGVRFSQFANYYIRGDINNFVHNNLKSVKVVTSKDRKKIFGNMYKMLDGEGSFSDKIKIIAKKLEVSEEDVSIVANHLYNHDRGYDTVPQLDKGSDSVGIDITHHYDNDNPAEHLISKEQRKIKEGRARWLLKTLPEKDSNLLRDRYFTYPALTLKEIAERDGVSFQAVSQREKKLTKRITAKYKESELLTV